MYLVSVNVIADILSFHDQLLFPNDYFVLNILAVMNMEPKFSYMDIYILYIMLHYIEFVKENIELL